MTAEVKARICRACGRSFDPTLRPFDRVFRSRTFCTPECRARPSPAVYRYVCPDGRSYVGAVANIEERNEGGICRLNPWLAAAFERHPPETFVFEVLERLTPGCTKRELRAAEQRHIERLRSWSPEAGFNFYPAVWGGDGVGQVAARKRRGEQVRAWREERQRRAMRRTLR
jgi:hypothetical protein